jgi:hypothetical protein
VRAGDKYLIPVSAFEKWLAECNQANNVDAQEK